MTVRGQVGHEGCADCAHIAAHADLYVMEVNWAARAGNYAADVIALDCSRIFDVGSGLMPRRAFRTWCTTAVSRLENFAERGRRSGAAKMRHTSAGTPPRHGSCRPASTSMRRAVTWA